MYGFRAWNGTKQGPARKGAGFTTNSICIAQSLNKRCPNRRGHQVHQHGILEGGRTRVAQVYQAGPCKAICEGLQEQMAMDETGQFLIMIINDTRNTTSGQLKKGAEKMGDMYKTVEETYGASVPGSGLSGPHNT